MSFLKALFVKESVVDAGELERIRSEYDAKFAHDMDQLEFLLKQGNRPDVMQRLPRVAEVYCDTAERRRRLGWLYWNLGYKAMAGRCWYYLQQEKTPEMEEARSEFEKSCGDNPVVIHNSTRACTMECYNEMHYVEEPAYNRLSSRLLKEAEWAKIYGITAEMRFAVGLAIFFACLLLFALIGIASLGIWVYDA